MADLAFEHEIEERSAETGSSYADDAVGRGVSALDGRCDVRPDQPLPGLSTFSVQAFVAIDRNDASQQMYALITDPLIPFRLNVFGQARDLGDVSVVKPVQWGSVDWPHTQRRETMLLLQRPPGEPLMPSIDAQIRPLKVSDITKNLIKPVMALLSALADQRLVHRNIRPTNLFRAGSDGPITVGEFYSTPAGFNQPSMFEPIERAMCPPAGRGYGDSADDLFALGVTALFLVLGRNPVAHVDPETLLARRVVMGSYAALTKDHKPPGELAPVIRSLMHDRPSDRWTIEDLSRWVDSGVAVQATPITMVRADRGFEFANGRHHTRRALALAFGKNWQAAREVVLTDAVERWAERSIEDRDLSQQIVACRHSGSSGPRMISDDLLLARTIIALDPEGPLRFRGLSIMPDGLCAMAALTADDTDMSAAFSEMISSQLMEFWLEHQSRSSSVAVIGKNDAEKLLTYLGKPGPGFGIERGIYDLNKGLACQSPRFKHASVVHIRELMETLDAGAKKGEQQLDRHVTAFLGARYSGSIDSELKEFSGARSGEEALLAQLKIFAAVQFKHGPRELPNLAALIVNHLDILLAPYRNIDLRQRLHGAAERAAPTGKLPELLGIIANRKTLNADKKRFDQARRNYRECERQVHVQEDARERTADRSLMVGRKVAAYLSTCVGAAVVVMVVLAGLG
ncbi:MAG: hypothetical protein O7A62_01550 [Alphaproteobacteria bacterium]|nr:hypothetical protein [Alphaproteobacteria bacterium]